MRWPILILICLSYPAVAEIYRWIDSDGRVTFSDQRVPGAQRVEGPAKTVSPAETEGAPEPTGAYTGPYESFEMLAPEHETIATDTDGRLNVSLLVIPDLMPEHRIQILVDGAPVGEGQRNTQFSLQGLSPGTHQIRARILDAEGAGVAATESNSAHLRPSSPSDRPAAP